LQITLVAAATAALLGYVIGHSLVVAAGTKKQ
jgi:hypothetical protein